MSKKNYISLVLISSAVIAFQIVLMQILSLVQWHHFAFMIISLALLGFGAAGTILFLYRDWLVQKFDAVLSVLMMLSGIFINLSIQLAQLDFFRFDTYLLFADDRHIIKLLLTYFLFFIPFFFAALAIGLTFVYYSKNIGKLYFTNLLGSGLGGFGALVLLSIFSPCTSPTIVSVLSLLSGLILINKSNKSFTVPLGVICVVLVIYNFISTPELKVSQYKTLSKTLNLPDAEVVIEKSSPYGFIQVVNSNFIRSAPGLSLNYPGEIPKTKAVFNNGNWIGAIISRTSNDSGIIFNFTTDALIYRLAKKGKVLILDSGTGENVTHALNQNVEMVTSVESNSALNSIILNELAKDTDSLYHADNVELIEISSRTFLQLSSDLYDIVKLPTVGAFGGTSGTQAIHEEFLFTTESFRLILERLEPEGFFTVTSWMDYPYRNPLRILTTISEALNKHGIGDLSGHIISIRSWNLITFLVKKSKITSGDIETVKQFCEQMNFDPVILPGATQSERTKYNQLQDDKFFTYIDTLLSKNSASFIPDYPFRISAPTDDKPFFSQFLSWKNLSGIKEYFGLRSIPFFELGYLIVILTLLQAAVLSFILIILPLFTRHSTDKLVRAGENRIWTLFYFSGLGIGYMFIEIVLIQKFVLYFGNPILSASAVISFMLISSGIGSYFSSSLESNSKSLLIILVCIIAILLAYTFILDPFLKITLTLPVIFKILFSFVIIGVPAFAMGFPFPLGIRKLDRIHQRQIPWAWGINNCLSVISTALATVIAVELGFTAVFLFAALAYSFPFTASLIEMIKLKSALKFFP